MTKPTPARMRCRVEPALAPVQPAVAHERKGIRESHDWVRFGAPMTAASQNDGRGRPAAGLDLARVPADVGGLDARGRESRSNRSSLARVATGILHSHLPLMASIRIGASRNTARSLWSLGFAPQCDGLKGAEPPRTVDFLSLTPAPSSGEQAAAVTEPEEGQTVQLPDVKVPAMAEVAQRDPIAAALVYNGSIAQSGPAPDPFGETKPFTHALSGVSVTRMVGNFIVSATVDNPITFQVNGGADTSIASENDAAITQANYRTVATDLTPNMHDENGRPPRTQFWAEDLTIRHERFHAQEDFNFGRQGVEDARTWLNTREAGDVAGVQALLNQVPGKVAHTVAAGMTFPGLEERAYGDGAPVYKARADAVKTKGDAGGYGHGPGHGGHGHGP